MIHNLANLSAERAALLVGIVSQHKTLEDVTRWALSFKPPRLYPNAGFATQGDAEMRHVKAPGFDLVIQDEYSHDVVLPYDDLTLVYSTT